MFVGLGGRRNLGEVGGVGRLVGGEGGVGVERVA